VHVQVGDGLASIVALVDDETVAGLVDALAPGELSCDAQQPAGDLFFRVRQLRGAADVLRNAVTPPSL
jgi:hypothetical protein